MGDMGDHGNCDMIDKELADLVRIAERGEQGLCQRRERCVVDADARLKVEVADPASVGIIGTGIESFAGDMNVQRIDGVYTLKNRPPSQIMERPLPRSERLRSCRFAVQPELAATELSGLQHDHVSILDGDRQSRPMIRCVELAPTDRDHRLSDGLGS
jgi:hypothetical protein